MPSTVRLRPGETAFLNFEAISFDNQFKLVFQGFDGNLVLYDANNQAQWSAGTENRGASKCVMQLDGNLVIYDSHDNPLWSSLTSGNPFNMNNVPGLNIQNDGNVVIYQLVPIWWSGAR